MTLTGRAGKAAGLTDESGFKMLHLTLNGIHHTLLSLHTAHRGSAARLPGKRGIFLCKHQTELIQDDNEILHYIPDSDSFNDG